MLRIVQKLILQFCGTIT